jgi:hypothetical protein
MMSTTTRNADHEIISLDETLAQLSLLLKKKQQALDEREAEIDKATAALALNRSQVFGNKSSSDVLHLNVGGDHMTVLRRTLTSVEGSMLASRFSGRWDDTLEKDQDGNFFIDQPIELFRPMINFLRAKACETPLGPPIKSPVLRDYELRQDFYRLVEYFGMTPGIYPVGIELHRGETTAKIGTFPDCFVKSSEWSTFTVVNQGQHNREITSFEVVLGNVERMQIGWINSSKYVENLSEDNGVGEEENSIALDCCRGGLLNQGEFTKLDGLSFQPGSVIRCENRGHRWLVDGKLVVSSVESDETRHFENKFLPPNGNVTNGEGDKIIPCFSGKGHWTLSQIVLSCP